MKVTCVMVSSLDGRITKGDTPGTSEWASAEDQEIFSNLKREHDCIVMGAMTYRAARNFIQPTTAKPRVILTRNPEHFAEDADKPGLTFTSASPEEIIEDLEKAGQDKVLLGGGSATNALFLDAGLVDEIIVTVEPKLFGDGLPFMAPLHNSVDLQLIDFRQLNNIGSLLLHYSVNKP